MEMNTLEVFGQQLNNLAFNNTFICSNASTEPKTITFPTSYNLNSNLAFKVVFVNGHDCGSATYNFTLNGKPIKMNNSGTYQNLPVIQNASTFYSIQPGMTLDLYYDSTQDAFIVVGNPVVISNSSEKVLADGSKLWQFEKDKIASELGLTATYYSGNSKSANQLQAFTGDDFTGGNHFIKAIRDPNGWNMRLWTCYDGGAKQSDAVQVNYANSAGNADTVDGQHFTYSNADNNPTYLWGTNSDGSSILAHRGSMSVNYANSAGSAGSAGNADTVDGQHFTYSNTDNNPTYLWGTNSNGSSILASRASMSVSSADQAYKVFTQSHPGSWWLNANFDNVSLFILDTIAADGSRIPIKVGKSDDADTVDGYHVGTSAGQLIPVSSQSWSGSSGYIVYGNGLIIQWGRLNAERSTVYHNFSISFTSAETWIGAAQNAQNMNASAGAKIFRGTSGANFIPVAVNSNNERYTDLIDWIAIGY